MNLNDDSENEEPKNGGEDEEPPASTSRAPPLPYLFGSDAINLLSNDTFSLNSFNPMGINSADDIRQSVKSCMQSTEQSPQPNRDQEPKETAPGTSKESKDAGDQEPHCSKQKHHSRTKLKVVMPERGDKGPEQKPATQKRQGRPPKAGPSKKPKRHKKESITHLYIGKLTNYVRSNNRHSGSDSDTESSIYYSS